MMTVHLTAEPVVIIESFTLHNPLSCSEDKLLFEGLVTGLCLERITISRHNKGFRGLVVKASGWPIV
jgi:hypothetical protein